MFDVERNAWLRYANGYAEYWGRRFFLLWLRKLLHGPRVEDLSWHIPNHNFGSVTCSLIHGVRLCMCLHMCVWHTLHMYVFQAVRCTLCHLGSRGPLNQQSGFRNRRIKTARDSIHVVDTGTGACGPSADREPKSTGIQLPSTSGLTAQRFYQISTAHPPLRPPGAPAAVQEQEQLLRRHSDTRKSSRYRDGLPRRAHLWFPRGST